MNSVDIQTDFPNENIKVNINKTENNISLNEKKIRNERKKIDSKNRKIKKKKELNYDNFFPEKLTIGRSFCNGLQKGSLLGIPRMVQITELNKRLDNKLILDSWKYIKYKKQKPKQPTRLMKLIINQFCSEENQ